MPVALALLVLALLVLVLFALTLPLMAATGSAQPQPSQASTLAPIDPQLQPYLDYIQTAKAEIIREVLWRTVHGPGRYQLMTHVYDYYQGDYLTSNIASLPPGQDGSELTKQQREEVMSQLQKMLAANLPEHGFGFDGFHHPYRLDDRLNPAPDPSYLYVRSTAPEPLWNALP